MLRVLRTIEKDGHFSFPSLFWISKIWFTIPLTLMLVLALTSLKRKRPSR